MKPGALARGVFLIGATVSAAAASVQAAGGPAPAYPTKAIRLIVPLSPGGGTDIFARALGLKLAEKFGQPVVVDNRPGASGTVGSDIAKWIKVVNTVGIRIN